MAFPFPFSATPKGPSPSAYAPPEFNVPVKESPVSLVAKKSRVSLVAKKQVQFLHRFFEMVASCSYSTGTGRKIGQDTAFQKAIALLKQVKASGGVVYVVGNGKDKVPDHFTTDLMKGLEITAQTISADDPELACLTSKDLVVVVNHSTGKLFQLLDQSKRLKQRPQIITVSEGANHPLRGYGDLNFSIPISQDSALTKMTRLHTLHTIVDLYLRPKSNVQERIRELSLCTAFCNYTDGAGRTIKPAVFTGEALSLIARARARNGKVYVIGNGGSDQIAGDIKDQLLSKGVLAKTLTVNSCLTTCLSNDKGYQDIFSYQFERHLKPEDVVIAISSSGKSPNILNAVQTAKAKRAAVITLSGFKKGNPLSKLGNVNLHIERADYGLVEIGHFLVLLNLVDAVSRPIIAQL